MGVSPREAASPVELPDDLVQLADGLTFATAPKHRELFRECILNAYRRGHGEGKLEGLNVALNVALETAKAELVQ